MAPADGTEKREQKICYQSKMCNTGNCLGMCVDGWGGVG